MIRPCCTRDTRCSPCLPKLLFHYLDYVKTLTAEEAAAQLPESHRAPTALHRLVASQAGQGQIVPVSEAVASQVTEPVAREKTPDLLNGSSLDILLGRRGTDNGASDLDQLLRWTPSTAEGQANMEEDLTSFSTGGDIFGEIAAAAAEDHQRSPSQNDGIFTRAHRDDQEALSLQAQPALNSQSRSVLLPAHEIEDPSIALTPTIPSDLRASVPSNVVDPDWVPKISPDGRIFYYSTRTGQSAYDLPSPSTSSSVSRHIRSESGTATSDKSKWASGGTSVSDLNHDLKASSSTSGLPKGIPPSGISTPSMQRLSVESSSHSQSSPFAASSSGPSRQSDGLYVGKSLENSLIDHAVTASITPRKASIATARSVATNASKRSSAVAARKLEAAVNVLKPSPSPILAHAERRCVDALSRLSSAIQKRSEAYDRKRTSADLTFEEEEVSCREELVDASIDVNNATRQLLALTDVILEQPQHTALASSRSNSSKRSSREADKESARQSSEPLQALPAIPTAEFRPLAMKITATESKLMLSMRTTWGLLATSPAEEASVAKGRKQEGLSEKELASLQSQSNIQLASRRDIDTKLRFDLLVQTRTLGDAIATFVEQVEAFAEQTGCTVTKSGLQLPIPAQAEPLILPQDVLLPAASTAGSARGHGFEHYFPSPSKRRHSHTERGLYEKPYVRPRRLLSAPVLQDLQSDRKALLGDLSALKTIFQTILPAQVKATSLSSSLIPTVTSQTMGFLNRLGRFLRQLEDVDIAGCLDVEYDGLGPPCQGINSDEASYLTSLKRAASTLRTLTQQKQALYSVPPRVLLVVQGLTAYPSCYPLSATSTPPSQPREGSPLGCCARPTFEAGLHGSSILQTLGEVSGMTESLLASLGMLLSIAEEQAHVPSALRQASANMRLKEAARAQALVNSWSQDDDTAEELETDRGTTSSLNGTVYSPGQRISLEQATTSSEQLARTPSTQSITQRRDFGSRTSRSNSLAESLSSDVSPFSGYAKGEDPRTALLDADFRGEILVYHLQNIADHESRLKDSPANHSPSKSKLKQFFGDEAPGQVSQIIRRPTQASREVPLFLQQDYPHDQITFAMDNSVKAGTLHALVCRLTNHLSADSQYNNAFLMTYRTFTDANELLERLKSRYYLEPPHGLTRADFATWTEQKQKLVRVRYEDVILLTPVYLLMMSHYAE